ncbi:MAG: gamma-glutamylcyclotransferase family protein [Parafilimonas sp.]
MQRNLIIEVSDTTGNAMKTKAGNIKKIFFLCNPIALNFAGMKLTSSSQLFVYGSLRKGFHNDAYNYISKYFTFVCNGKVKGILNDMGSYPVATPATEDFYIVGELYKINSKEEFPWAIAQIDDYEGVNVEQDEQLLYKRELATVYKDDGTATQAWIYWYIGDTTGKPIISSGDVLQYLETRNYNTPHKWM